MDISYLLGKNVISLPPIRTERMYSELNQVEAYWEGLRDGRVMPARSEVDPRGITNALDCAFILERIAPGLARLRLAGHHMSELMGMELRGMPVSALFLPDARPRLAKMLDMVFDQPASMRLKLTSDSGITRAALEAEMFLAPLRDRNGEPSRAIGALKAHGRIGRAPRRFRIDEVSIRSLMPDQPVAPVPVAETHHETRPERAQPRADHPGHKIPGFFEHAKGFAPAPGTPPAHPAPIGERPYLKLVVSNDE